ncbi:hypothetical protein PSEUDO8Z_100180 [Pseudomonas sp. 8Z]|nr:hypothetical protein PSEUDO8Z_100180 [Pseudomonas sp. 8Z]
MNKAANNPKTAHWQALSQAHHLAPFSDYKQLAEKGPRIITEAQGVHLWVCISRCNSCTRPCSFPSYSRHVMPSTPAAASRLSA